MTHLISYTSWLKLCCIVVGNTERALFLNWSENLENDQNWSYEVFPHDKQCSHYVSLDLSLCPCWTEQQSEDDSHQRDGQENVNGWLIFTDGTRQRLCVYVFVGSLLLACSGALTSTHAHIKTLDWCSVEDSSKHTHFSLRVIVTDK